MLDPVVSVIIPLYNRADLIAATLQSVLKQSFQNFEILVIDDGSSDTPEKALDALSDPRIRLIKQANAGANAARNRGIMEARGLYVAMLDADDQYLPHHLERSVKVISNSPNTVVYSRIIVDRGNETSFLKPPRGLGEGEPVSEYLMCSTGFMQTSTVVLSTDLARKAKYLEGLPYGQDIDFAIRLDHAGASFTMLQDPGAIWRDWPDPKRISANSRPEVRLAWLDKIRPLITEKAYLGFLGWRIAKAEAEAGSKLSALRAFFRASIAGCYSVKHAMVICLQILLVGRPYRIMSDVFLVSRRIFRR